MSRLASASDGLLRRVVHWHRDQLIHGRHRILSAIAERRVENEDQVTKGSACALGVLPRRRNVDSSHRHSPRPAAAVRRRASRRDHATQSATGRGSQRSTPGQFDLRCIESLLARDLKPANCREQRDRCSRNDRCRSRLLDRTRRSCDHDFWSADLSSGSYWRRGGSGRRSGWEHRSERGVDRSSRRRTPGR